MGCAAPACSGFVPLGMIYYPCVRENQGSLASPSIPGSFPFEGGCDVWMMQ